MGLVASGVNSVIKAGVTNHPAAEHENWSGPVRNQATQQEVSLNVMHLNHPETIPAPAQFVEKLSSSKLVPGANKVGDAGLRVGILSSTHLPSGKGKGAGGQSNCQWQVI